MWSVDPGVVLALHPFVLTSCSILIYVGVDWGFLKDRCSWIDYPNVDEEHVSSFDALDVCTDMFRSIAGRSNLTNFELQAEGGLLDARLEFLDELVDLSWILSRRRLRGPLSRAQLSPWRESTEATKALLQAHTRCNPRGSLVGPTPSLARVTRRYSSEEKYTSEPSPMKE